MASDFARGNPVSGVKCWLAAAGLIIGKFDADAEVFEDFDGRFGGVIVKGIAKTSAHQEHFLSGGARELAGHGVRWKLGRFQSFPPQTRSYHRKDN